MFEKSFPQIAENIFHICSGERKMDREKIRLKFQDHVSYYDLSDPKIRLKIDHTYRVADLCKRIAGSLSMSEELIEVAWVCGMLHDIGRFEQVRRFHTFMDSESVDHAKFGVQLLFGEKKLIRRFLEETKWDEQIKNAICWHSAYQLPENLKEAPFCRILRDADKLDILRANLETPLEDIYNVTTEELRTGEVTPEVMEAVKKHHTVLRSKKKSPVDHVVGHICLTFELVYPESRKILKEQGYLERMLHFTSENPKTCEQFEEIRAEMQRYLETEYERRRRTDGN